MVPRKRCLCPPSLQRTSKEQAVLNDVWVSVPVGSEGGGSDVAFKHIRKNQHEDLLFKVQNKSLSEVHLHSHRVGFVLTRYIVVTEHTESAKLALVKRVYRQSRVDARSSPPSQKVQGLLFLLPEWVCRALVCCRHVVLASSN